MRRVAILATACAVLCMPSSARADWLRDSTSIAWRSNGTVVWQFSFDARSGKPFFHPVAVGAGPSLTNFKPQDHPWHYGLWFSWKYINRVNYWEEDRTSGHAAGSTRWSTPVIDAYTDGSARITLELTYARPSGEVDLTEQRTLDISAPRADGGYTIDWTMRFTAGKEGAILDRTAMPGEPNGAVNGGYAGLSARLAASPLAMSVITTHGPVGAYVADRARPFAAAVAANFTDDGRPVGSLAILSDSLNAGGASPWYIINSPTDFRFMCAAVLAPAIRTLQAGSEWTLRYRVALRAEPYTTEALQAAMAGWPRT